MRENRKPIIFAPVNSEFDKAGHQELNNKWLEVITNDILSAIKTFSRMNINKKGVIFESYELYMVWLGLRLILSART